MNDVSKAMETRFLPNWLMRDHKSLYTKLWLGTKPSRRVQGSRAAKIGGPERLLVWQE